MSALSASLFPDQVPQAVYDNLIEAVRSRLPAVYRYLDLRRRKLRIKEIHQYDSYVPLLADLDSTRSWNDAVKLVISSLKPLGNPYCQTLQAGLRGRWCDRYPGYPHAGGGCGLHWIP